VLRIVDALFQVGNSSTRATDADRGWFAGNNLADANTLPRGTIGTAGADYNWHRLCLQDTHALGASHANN
jgi:hypothetical protein